MADPLKDDDPRRVGPYRLEGRLGNGGMGQVFLGRTPGGRPVALKLVPGLADDTDLQRRFFAEVEAARTVGGFYTAQVVDADPSGDPPWLATAYIAGLSLEDTVVQCGPLSTPSVASVGAGLAEALVAVHAHGLVHRDLKPGNVILAEDGPRLIDFGIARSLEATSYTRTRTVLGTAAYMSPEQATGTEVGPASDVFSLGCVLAFAATGQSPFGSGTAEAVAYRIVHEEPDLAGVPGRLVRVISSCLEKKPARRASLEQVLDRLARLAPDGERTARWRLPELVGRAARRVAEFVPTQLGSVLGSDNAPDDSTDPPTERWPARRPRRVRAWQAYASLLVSLCLLVLALVGWNNAALIERIRTLAERDTLTGPQVLWVLLMLPCALCCAGLIAAQLRRFTQRIANLIGGTVLGLLTMVAGLAGLVTPPLAFYGTTRVVDSWTGPVATWWGSLAVIVLTLVLAIGWYSEGAVWYVRKRNGGWEQQSG